MALSTVDFSSFLLQAQASGAQVLGLANAGDDFVNSPKAANEFGISKTMKRAGLLVYINDINGPWARSSARFVPVRPGTGGGSVKTKQLHYRDVCQEIKDIQSKWDSEALTDPLRVLDQDPQYRAAREAIADRVQELQKRIVPS